MPAIYKQALAEQDLVDIWLHSLQEWGEQQADTYLDEMERIMLLLLEQPKIGRLREEFQPPVHVFYHAQHLIVYQIIPAGISIIRVLHKSMDVDRQIS